MACDRMRLEKRLGNEVRECVLVWGAGLLCTETSEEGGMHLLLLVTQSAGDFGGFRSHLCHSD